MTDNLVWIITIGLILGLFLFDFFVVVRKPHEPTFKESVSWSIFYIAIALVFGASFYVWSDATAAAEYFAGYVTEKSLSVDNLFVFLVIMSRFAVPLKHRQRVLLIGIGIALVLRGLFIAAGATVLENFSWAFYLFGAFLLWTAVSIARDGADQSAHVEYKENRAMVLFRKVVPATDSYRGGALMVKERARRLATPMLLVMVAIGTTDVLFALDSIPAIFGLTKDPFIVFTANAFALLGLRQLFFVVEGLLRRLIYLSYGLAAILVFIGVKLVLEALHLNELSWINGGEPVDLVPHIPIWFSLSYILVVVTIAAAASLVVTRRPARAVEVDAQRGEVKATLRR
ncbi:MAG: TerC family protein [Demequina sp.]